MQSLGEHQDHQLGKQTRIVHVTTLAVRKHIAKLLHAHMLVLGQNLRPLTNENRYFVWLCALRDERLVHVSSENKNMKCVVRTRY